METMVKNKKIVDEFFEDYYRVPRYDEFIKLGGSFKPRKMYGKMLKSFGYSQSTKTSTVQVYDDRNRLIFEGTVKEVAEEFERDVSVVRRAVKNGSKLCWLYTCKYKKLED